MAEQEYTPTEAEIRDTYGVGWNARSPRSGTSAPHDVFSRWLAAHDAEVRADERAKRPDREAAAKRVYGLDPEMVWQGRAGFEPIAWEDATEEVRREAYTVAEAALGPEARKFTDARRIEAVADAIYGVIGPTIAPVGPLARSEEGTKFEDAARAALDAAQRVTS